MKRKDTTITMKISKTDLELIRKDAKKVSLSVSEFMRRKSLDIPLSY